MPPTFMNLGRSAEENPQQSPDVPQYPWGLNWSGLQEFIIEHTKGGKVFDRFVLAQKVALGVRTNDVNATPGGNYNRC